MKNTFISKILTLCAIVMISTNVQAQFSGGSGRGDNKADLMSCGSYQIPSSVGTYSFTVNHTDGTTADYSSHYLSGSCLSMGTIVDAAGGNVLGSTTLTMTLSNSVLLNSTDRMFVPRYVNVSPTSNGTVDMQLYYSQADFDTYNAAAVNQQRSLPVNSADTANFKSNLKVMRAATNTTEVANLTDITSTTTWDATSNLWVVSLTGVTASGFYYLTTDYITPLTVGTINHTCPTVLTSDQASRATIDWADVLGVTRYNIRYRLVGSPTWSTTTTLYASISTITGLAFGSDYEVQIQVKLNNILGSFKSYTFTTPSELPLCMPPTTLNHNLISNSTTNFSWNASTYGILYQIQVREKNTIYWGGTSTAGLNRSFTYLKGATDYEYQVRTKCLVNATRNPWSAYSSIAKLTTLPNPPTVTCLPPTNSYSTINNANSVTINWDTASNADFYTIRLQKAGDTTWGGKSSTLNTISFNYLTQNTKYYYKIRTRCLASTTINELSDFTTLDSFMTPFIKSVPTLIFNDINAAWTVYPNPTQDVLNVQFISAEDANVVIKVSDMTGRLVKTISTSSVLGNNLIDVNVAELVNGIYTLQVIQADKLKYVTKFTKQN